jgi:hypothetical protein
MCGADDVAMDTYDGVPLGVECAWPSAALAELRSALPAVPSAAPDEPTETQSAPQPKR